MNVDLISRIAEKARANSSSSIPTNNSDLIINLPITTIKYHPKNHLYFRDLDKAMKDMLMEDMRDNGQINPIIVKKNEDATYSELAGHQRLIAARRLNWQQIKAIVIEVSEYEAEKLLIRDNLFRRHMGGMELARALPQ
jgi:ParB family transcriptional regulator, chromosome partitioning protein